MTAYERTIIRRRWIAGETQREIATSLGVSPQAVNGIINRDTKNERQRLEYARRIGRPVRDYRCAWCHGRGHQARTCDLAERGARHIDRTRAA